MNRVMGIDSSTQGVAWSVVQDGKPIKYGKIELSKIIGMNAKLKKIAEEFPKILADTKPEHIFIERTIFVRSAATARVLAYVVGALMVLLLQLGYNCEDVDIPSWKKFTGYTNLNRKFTLAAAKKLGKLPAKKLCEEMRKSQTQRMLAANFPNFTALADNDICDATAIALWGYNSRCKKIELKKTKDICLDLARLDTMGLGGLL